MKNQLQTFENTEFGKIRVIEIDGLPWFVGRDVAEALSYVNSKKALGDHVDREDKQVLLRSRIGTLDFDIPNRGLTVINESGLYSLILSSKLPVRETLQTLGDVGGASVDPQARRLYRRRASGHVRKESGSRRRAFGQAAG
jgi:prophage antirepressor-like protein